MDPATIAILAGAIGGAAILYSSVGHSGASGYLAVMALASIAPDVMKPTALVLNVLVASIATFKFHRAGHFNWQLFWPFALTSIPFAAVGGAAQLPGHFYRPLVGIVLLIAAIRFLVAAQIAAESKGRPPLPLALGVGAGLGCLSGLTGVGGGIFLSPLLVFTGWGGIRETAGVSALFILVNSISGLTGHLASVQQIPSMVVWWGAAAILGGTLGAELGSRRANIAWLRRLLGVVLIVAGLKMLFW